MKSKKGQTKNIIGIIIALVVAGLVLGTGFWVINEYKGQMPIITTGVVNESLGAVTAGSNVSLAQAWAYSANAIAINQSTPSFGNDTLNTGNYTITSNETSSWFNLKAGSSFSGNVIKLTYNYRYQTEAYRAVRNAESGIFNISSMFGLIVLVAIAGIVISLVINGFAGRSR